jgi:TPR repeat protein
MSPFGINLYKNYLLDDGKGIGVNHNKSFELLEKSARKGHLNAISM